ncbi:MAG TPA: hypothetical protein PKA88_07395 [Polyangiaceae bacterium]|nr:hypothetical protein [Polyangiaceae bacterium]
MKKRITLVSLVALGCLSVGCSSSRDIQVKGEILGAASQQSMLVEFWELNSTEQNKVHSMTVAAPGSFEETVPLEGDTLLVRVIADADGNEACSAGESWGESIAQIVDEEAPLEVSVSLSSAACDTSEIGR